MYLLPFAPSDLIHSAMRINTEDIHSFCENNAGKKVLKMRGRREGDLLFSYGRYIHFSS